MGKELASGKLNANNVPGFDYYIVLSEIYEPNLSVFHVILISTPYYNGIS
jgi:hypothetical protein